VGRFSGLVRVPSNALGGERRQSVSARLLAISTHLFADAAVLVMTRVPFALVAAQATGFLAGLQSDAGDLGNELGLPREDATGRDADVTAVVTQRDAGNHRLDIRLAQVGVSAGGAALSAVEASVDARDQGSEGNPKCPRVRLEYLLSVGHDPPRGSQTGG
jgi:hypothetical protein